MRDCPECGWFGFRLVTEEGDIPEVWECSAVGCGARVEYDENAIMMRENNALQHMVASQTVPSDPPRDDQRERDRAEMNGPRTEAERKYYG